MPEPPDVLAAEADPAVNQLVAVVLGRAGFRVGRVSDPSAVAAALTPEVQLVVLGGCGGGVCAAAVAADLRARGATTPLLILSGQSNPEADAVAAADPTVLVLHKPFRPADLTSAALTLIDGA